MANSFSLDKSIKDKFKLFQGLRSKEEDEKIFNKAYELCFEDIIRFLYENLTEKQRNNLISDLRKESETNKKISVLFSYTTKVKDYNTKLEKRLDTFLDELLKDSIKNSSKRSSKKK